MLRRPSVLLLSVMLAAGACSDGDGDTTAGPAASTTTSAAATATTERFCTMASAVANGQITWLDGGDLVAKTPAGEEVLCLVRDVGDAPAAVQWSGDASKVLVGDMLRTVSGAAHEFAGASGLRLSRPTGRSVAQVAGDRILK